MFRIQKRRIFTILRTFVYQSLSASVSFFLHCIQRTILRRSRLVKWKMQAVFSCRDILHITTGLPLRPLNSETFSQKFLVKICIETVLAVQVSLAFFVIDTGIFFLLLRSVPRQGSKCFVSFLIKSAIPQSLTTHSISSSFLLHQ